MTGTEKLRRRATAVVFLVAALSTGAGLLPSRGAVPRVRAQDRGLLAGPTCALDASPPGAEWAALVSSDASLLACMPTAPSYHGSAGVSGARGGDDPALPIARRAHDALAAHQRAGRTQEALVSLATLREMAPELSDRWDLVEGSLLPHEARGCEAFERAIESPLSAIGARARVGHVRCLIAVRDRHASDALRQLLARYPELPEANELRLLDAAAHEERGDHARAIAIYRDVDLMFPETRAAADARERLDALAADGRRVRALTPLQLAERADRLVRNGPPDLAREEIARLRAMRLPAPQRAEVTLLAARIARVEGRFGDAERLTREARGVEPATVPATIAGSAGEPSSDRLRAQEDARQELARFTGRARTLRNVNTTRLFGYLRVAARAGLRAEVDSALDELTVRATGSAPRPGPTLPCGLRLEGAVVATGSGDDLRIARLLEGCVEQRGSTGTAARYHRARAFERAGMSADALVELERVIEQDQSDTRWYAMWARQRRDAIAAALPPGAPRVADLAPDGLDLDPSKTEEAGTLAASLLEVTTTSDAPVTTAPPVRASTPAHAAASAEEAEIAPDAPSPPWRPLEPAEIERRLAAVAAEHGEGFPWFARALTLLRLGDREGATDELHEAMLAWNEARGRGVLRAGVEAVYRGATPPRSPLPPVETRRLRRALDVGARGELAEISASLGDHGLAIRFAGPGRASMRPRAYEQIVRDVAAERGIDHNLLLAVMRVESVYSPRIVSYAGAIGLLQIMPRTGRLIARSMGREDFGIDDLLDPRTNIEFAAWYLSSLIRRFDGRVPLAVASYNGGPHNVRRWMSEHSDEMPIDAFCERIPFDQTHRYVRRVLSHWAAYRAQEGLAMPQLDPSLPALEADRVAF